MKAGAYRHSWFFRPDTMLKINTTQGQCIRLVPVPVANQSWYMVIHCDYSYQLRLGEAVKPDQWPIVMNCVFVSWTESWGSVGVKLMFCQSSVRELERQQGPVTCCFFLMCSKIKTSSSGECRTQFWGARGLQLPRHRLGTASGYAWTLGTMTFRGVFSSHPCIRHLAWPKLT